MVEHGNVCNFHLCMAAILGINGEDRLLAVTSLSFDIAGLELFLPLTVGASVFIANRATAMDGTLLASVLTRNRISVLQGTPAIWRLLKEMNWQPQTALKALCGGEAMPADVELYLKSLPGKAFNLYGPTETTIWSMIAEINKDAQKPDLHIGRPIWNTQIYLLDALLNPVPEGAAGEIHIGGDGVARGYRDRPDLTAERFIQSPFAAGERLYKTGDLARYRHDGNIDYLGRNDFQVKVRGFRIELGEIEARLSTHPDIREAAVLVREDDPGNKRLVGYYTCDEQIGAEALRGHLAETLPDYMIPAAYVVLEVLPLTPNGKLDRKALPRPSDEAFGRGAYEEPVGPVETALAKIWSEVLGVEKIGRNDNFFDLGGHSLLAVRMLERMRRAGIRVDVRTIFASPVLSAIAASVAA
jgi:acyl-coenzyme A synthetase/AMP-(fatty) acid ligase/aryl carrier-like protein